MSRRTLGLLALALAAIVVVAYVRVVIGGQTWADPAYQTTIVPPRLAAASAVQAGELPAWWDGSGLGVPLAGEPSHGALAPPLWLAATPRALDLMLLLYMWWAALGTALWARRAGASELGALCAGAFAATAGVVATSALHGTLPALAHLPWVGWAASGRSRRAAVALGVAIGAVAVAGSLGALIDAVVLAICVSRSWRRLAIGVAAGLAIGAAQWLPALLVDGAGAAVPGFPLARLGELIAPAGAMFVGAPLLALAAIARPDRRVLAALIAFAALSPFGRLGGLELHVGAIALVAAMLAARGVDALVAGERRATLALALATVVAAAGLAVPRASLFEAVIGVACAGAAAFVAWRMRRAPLAITLAMVPSLAAVQAIAPTVDRGDDPPQLARAAAVVPAPRRLFRPVGMPGLYDSLETLAGTSPARWDIAAARDDDPARPREFDATWFAAAHEGGALLERFGIALAILPASTVKPRGFDELARVGPWALVRYPTVPVAAVYSVWEWMRDDKRALAKLFPSAGGAARGRARVILHGEGMPNEEAAVPPAPCTIEQWSAGAIDLACRAPGDAYAVVSSTAARGWSVTVDDRDAAWVTADVLRRAVAVPAGEHRVRWRYTAPGLAPGLALAGLGALALVALWLWARRHDDHPDDRDAAA